MRSKVHQTFSRILSHLSALLGLLCSLLIIGYAKGKEREEEGERGGGRGERGEEVKGEGWERQ